MDFVLLFVYLLERFLFGVDYILLERSFHLCETSLLPERLLERRRFLRRRFLSFVYLLERGVFPFYLYLSGFHLLEREGGFSISFSFSTFCQAVTEGGGVRPLFASFVPSVRTLLLLSHGL